MIQRLDLQQWMDFDARKAAPTFFARPAWALSLSQAYPNMRPAPMRICARGSEPVVLPLVQMAGGALRWRDYSGFPLGAYTCFLNEDGTPANQRNSLAALEELGRHADVAALVPWPLHPLELPFSGAEHETAVVDLSDGLDAAMSRVEGIFRRMAGQAERRGVVCERDCSESAVDTYYELLEKSAQRWGLGKPNIPKALIQALVRNGGDDVQIWFARAEGQAIGGGVIFFGSDELFFWSAAMDSAYSRLRPSNALNFALLRAAAQRGVRWYNLGASEGLPGVARFKEHLGATPMTYRDVQLAGPRFRIYQTIRRKMPRLSA